MAIESINPATGDRLASFTEDADAEIEARLERAATAFVGWRRLSFAQRARCFTQAAAILRANQGRYAGLITLEMGKPIVQAEAEIEKCAWACEYFAAEAENLLSDQAVSTSARQSYVAFEPLGVVLAVMPWNFPFWQLFRFAVPALMAGNVSVMKHSSNVPQCAVAIESVFQEAGFPPGVFQNLLLSGERAGNLISDGRIAAVTLTGSDAAGRKVAELAGRSLKKTVLELGGSDPFIVLPDANLERAAAVAVQARFQNTGQSCIASKRLIVEASVADEFEQRFVDGVRALRVGDPLDRTTQVGPLARADLRDDLERQIRESCERGARVLAGGEALSRPGFFYAPTVLSDVTEAMPVCREETFGPAIPILRVTGEAAAVNVANSTAFGLGASLWTEDIDRGRRLAREIQAGSVFINAMVASDPRLPFGGVKQSGYGRELGEVGIREFVNVQTIWVGGEPAAKSE